MAKTAKQIQDELRSYLSNKSEKDLKKSDKQLIAEDAWKKNTELQERRKQAQKKSGDKISRASKEMWKDPEHKVKRQKTLMATNELPEVRQRRSQSAKEMYQEPEYHKRHCETMALLSQDPEYRKKYLKGNSKKYQDPKYWEAYYAGIERREQDKSYHQRRIQAANAKICRRVQTPLGVFDSITLASRAHGMSNTETMRNRLKSPNFPEYFLLDDKDNKK